MEYKIKCFIAALFAFLMLCMACANNNAITFSDFQTQHLAVINSDSHEEIHPVVNTVISLSDIPEYSGLPFVEINNSVPFYGRRTHDRCF